MNEEESEPPEDAEPRCWLRCADGTRIRLDVRGLMVGRSLGCDVVVRDAAASSVHALFRVGPNGAEVRPLGRNPTRVNGEPVEGVMVLSDGDRVDIPGETLRVEIEGGPIAGTSLSWVLALPGGRLLGVQRALTIGGAPTDGVCVDGLPPGALAFEQAQGTLVLEPHTAVHVAAGDLAPGELHRCIDGERIRVGELEIAVRAEQERGVSTDAGIPLPNVARFTFRPSGGDLSLRYARTEVAVRLTEVRARLVATLLGGTHAYDPERWYPDEVLIPAVWPRQVGKTRIDVNILVHRVRRDLLKARLDPFALLERQDCAARFRLAPGATVEVS